MAKPAKKTRGKFIDEKYLGPEPDLSGRVPTVTELALAYNWYNYFYSNDDAKGFVIEHFKKNHKADKDLIRDLQSVPSYNLRNLGWSCRILDMGGNLPNSGLVETTARAIIRSSSRTELSSGENDSVQADVSARDSNGEEAQGDESQAGQKVSIQERIKNKTSDLIAELEDEIDIFINEGESKFKIGDWLRNKEVKPQIALKIADFYKPLYSELFDAFEGKDEELKKAYSRYKKPRLRAYMEFVREFVSACENRAAVVKVIRKPRKKKEKPASVVVGKMKYQEKNDEFGLTSIKATEVIGANQLWVFNTKYRNLSVYNAMGPAGLNVKGTTITGFDEKTSVTKKLRKPAEQVNKLMGGGKVVLRKFMDDIKCKPKAANGRINMETILLRVVK